MDSLNKLFNLLDMIMVSDPEIIKIAKRLVNGETTSEDEDYAWDRYGIDLPVIRCWVKDRKLGDQSWQDSEAWDWEESKYDSLT